MKTYEIIDDNTIRVFSNTGVHDYYKDTYDENPDETPDGRYSKFNKKVIIDDSVTDCRSMFEKCDSFNQDVVIPRGVKNCSRMFFNCSSFDRDIIIPDTVEICVDMFHGCGFNREIVLPEGLKNCAGMFSNSEFNHDIVLPNSVEDCHSMFISSRFNGNITFSENCKDYRGLIDKCREYKRYLVIPPVLKGTENLFSSCQEVNSIILFDNSSYTDIFIVSPYAGILFNSMLIIPKSRLFGVDVHRLIEDMVYIDKLIEVSMYRKGISIKREDQLRVTELKSVIVIEPLRYLKGTHGDGVINAINDLKARYPEDIEGITELILKMITDKEDVMSLTQVLDFKNENNLYRDSTEDIMKRFSFDESDNSDNGETSLF